MQEALGFENNLPIRILEEGFERDLVQRPNWSVEGNFMLLPIFSFDRKNPPSGGRILKTLPSVQNNTLVTHQVTVVTGQREVNGKFQLDSPPGEFDMNLLFCLMDLWDEQGRSMEGTVEFSFSLLTRRLQVNNSGTNFTRIRESILRLSRTKIESRNAFYSKEKGTYVVLSMGVISDATLMSGSGARAGRCIVQLDRNIIKNLQANFSTRIDRKVYQSLKSPLARRIFCIARFKEQLLSELGVLDFDVVQLAELIPMSARPYPSVIAGRLAAPVAELQEKGIFKGEFIKSGKTVVLRLTSMEAKIPSLIGVGEFQKFQNEIQLVYGKSLEELVSVSALRLRELVANDKRDPIEYMGRRYSWVYHVLDVFCDQIAHGYSPNDKVALLDSFLKHKAGDLKIRIDFVPVDVRAEKKRQDDSLKAVAGTRKIVENESHDLALETAQAYVGRLFPADYNDYVSRALKGNAMLQSLPREGLAVKSSVIQLIRDDILSGREFKLLPERAQVAVAQTGSTPEIESLLEAPTPEEVKEAFSHLDREAALSPEGLARRKEYLLKQARELASE